eukprot:gene17346-12400_t
MDTKAAVKRALQTPMAQNEVWQPIATAWFDKWKAYVNFDAVADVKKVEGLHPGPVDNGPLKGSIGDELRRDMEAERDYVLLPEATANMLLDVFGGGPEFPRHVNMVDDSIYRSMEVELWPVRVHLTLQDAVNDAKKDLFRAYVTTPTRIWLRETPPEPEVTDTSMGRHLTTDIVEWDGDWHVIGSAALSRRMKDIRGDGDCVELIIEVAPTPNPTPSVWPRSQLLDTWKSGIHKDDMFDARDAHGHFGAATVIHVSATGDLVVRYWTGGDDEWIPTNDFEYRIAPLHSHSRTTSVPTVDMTAPSSLHKRPREIPPATTGRGGKIHDAARVAQRWGFTTELVTELVTMRSK